MEHVCHEAKIQQALEACEETYRVMRRALGSLAEGPFTGDQLTRDQRVAVFHHERAQQRLRDLREHYRRATP